MANSHKVDLIVNKISILNDYSLEYIESIKGKLTPAGKYQVFLLTTAIVFNRLKAINAFNQNNINTDSLTYSVIEEATYKFEEYKNVHDKIYNTFKHGSAIIERTLNRENRAFFRNELPELRLKSINTIVEYNNEISRGLNFHNIYINIFIFPFLNVNLPANEVSNEKNNFISLVNHINFDEFENFKSIILKLVNTISVKLNEDSYFISNMSGQDSRSKNCYVATLVYEDIDHPKVQILRNFRDKKMSSNFFGKIFIIIYYKYSPILVKKLRNQFGIQKIVKYFLDIFINKISDNK
jgi:hypothetical protein